jgi:hypothetical protein
MKNSEDIMDIAAKVNIWFVFMFVIVSAMILVDGTPSKSLQWLFWLSCGGTLVSTGVFLIALICTVRD